MNITKLTAISLLALGFTGGCASAGRGAPATSETGAARSPIQTETLTPGVGSALFPDPAWREPAPTTR